MKVVKKVLKVILIIFIILIVLGIIGSFIGDKNTSSVPSNKEPSKHVVKVNKDPYAGYPDKEKSFISIVLSAKQKSKDASNDMQKGGIKSDRDDAICNLLTSKTVKGWIGVVDDIDSNSDGLGVLSIKIAPDVFVQTSNNAISDIDYGTLIDPHSPVFKKASTLKKGDLVMFSGRFFASEDSDCLGEWSMTLNGKIKKPEFVFKFTDINKYKIPDFPIEACKITFNYSLKQQQLLDDLLKRFDKINKVKSTDFNKYLESGFDDKLKSLITEDTNLVSDDPRIDMNQSVKLTQNLIDALSKYSVSGDKNLLKDANNTFYTSQMDILKRMKEKCPNYPFGD
ncbi:hypothetical protein LOI60_000638 [Salmonella enterica]|nr:hypothetical protein [Salmonella enterica]